MKTSIQNKVAKARKPRVYIEYDVEPVSDEIVKHLSKVQLLYSVFGLAIGFVVMILGCSLLYLGIAGESHFIADIIGAKVELSDAAPGTVLIAVGLLVIIVTKFRFTLKKKDKNANKVNQH